MFKRSRSENLVFTNLIPSVVYYRICNGRAFPSVFILFPQDSPRKFVNSKINQLFLAFYFSALLFLPALTLAKSCPHATLYYVYEHVIKDQNLQTLDTM